MDVHPRHMRHKLTRFATAGVVVLATTLLIAIALLEGAMWGGVAHSAAVPLVPATWLRTAAVGVGVIGLGGIIGAVMWMKQVIVVPMEHAVAVEAHLLSSVTWQLRRMNEGRFGSRCVTPYGAELYDDLVGEVNTLSEMLSDSLEAMRLAMCRMGGGDLTARFEGDVSGSLLAVQTGFNQGLQELTSLVDGLSEANDPTVEAAAALNTHTHSLATALRNRMESVSEVERGAELLAGVARHTADNACATRAIISQTEAEVTEGNERVGQLVSTQRQLRGMAERSRSVMEDIRALATQLEMLSVNAGIQAARGGLSGDGGRQIAGATRRMGDRSQQIADQFSEILDEVIQIGVRASDDADAVAEWAGKMRNQIEKLVHVSAEVAAASGEAAQDAEQLSSTASEITPVLREIAAEANQAAFSSQSLTVCLGKTTSALARFSTGRDQGACESLAPQEQGDAAPVERLADSLLAEMMSEADDLFPMGDDDSFAET